MQVHTRMIGIDSCDTIVQKKHFEGKRKGKKEGIGFQNKHEHNTVFSLVHLSFSSAEGKANKMLSELNGS